MTFRKPKKSPEFAPLKSTLAQSKETENALYQTLAELIDRLAQLKTYTDEKDVNINNSINKSNTTINIKADKDRTYVTYDYEAASLPKSRQLIAGTGITLDKTPPNEIIISASGGGGGMGSGYWIPITNGDPVSPELLFDSNGDCIVGFQPF